MNSSSEFKSVKSRQLKGLPWLLALPLLVASGVTLCVVAVLFVVGYHVLAPRLMPQLFTDALPSEVIVDLCNTLELGDSDERCRGGDTLSVAFVPDFIARYESGATREQIDREIGTYLVECSEWVETPSDGIFQSCRYDFNGDGAYTILVVYRDVYQPDFTIREGHSGGHIYRVTSQYPAAGIGR